MNTRWKTSIILVGVLLAALVAASEAILPGIAERRVSERITERLHADISNVDVEAFPAARLLFKDYERIGFTMPPVIEAPDRLKKLGVERLALEPTAEGDLIAADPGSNLSLRLVSDGSELKVEAEGMGPFATFLIDRRLDARLDVGLTDLEASRVPEGIRLELEGLKRGAAA